MAKRSLQRAEPSLLAYLAEHDIPDILESLLTGVLVAQPEHPWDYLIDLLTFLESDDHRGFIQWDMFVEESMRPPKPLLRRGWMGSVFGFDDDGTLEACEKAYNFYLKSLTRMTHRAWRRYAVNRINKRAILANRMQEMRVYYVQRLKRIHLQKWKMWLADRKKRLEAFEVRLCHISNVCSERFIFKAWHKYAQEVLRTARWFKACEGDFDEEETTDGGGVLRAPGFDDVSLLPHEVSLQIFSYLNVPDLAHCSSVCRTWKVIVQQSALWSRVDLSTCGDKLTNLALMAIIQKCRLFLVHLNLRGCCLLTTMGFRSIGDCHNLQDLNLSECSGLTVDAMQNVVTGCRGLLFLNLSYTGIDDMCLRVLAKNSTNMQYLSLSHCTNFTNRGLRYLATGKGCHKVIYLDISGCEQLTTEAMWSIGKACSQLRTLIANDIPSLTDDALRAVLGECRELKSISLLGAGQLTDVSLKYLGRQAGKRLTSLMIEDNSLITDSSIRSLSHCQLSHLFATNCTSLTDQSLRALGQCKQLTCLHVADCLRMSDSGVRHLLDGVGGRLKQINLTNCVRVSDVTLIRMVKSCHNLTHASFCYCEHVTNAGVEMLSMLPSLISLDVTGCSVGNEGISCLGTNPRFKAVYLSECNDVTDNGLQKMCINCPNLEVLDVSFCTQVTDSAMKNLAFFCHLMTSISVAHCSELSDTSVQFLSSGCHYLKSLNLTGCVKITEKSLRYLRRGCSILSHLVLIGCQKVSINAIRRLQMRNLDVTYSMPDTSIVCSASRNQSRLEHSTTNLPYADRSVH